MTTFIRIVEIWVPTEDHKELQFHDGLYGPYEAFRALSQRMRFRSNEGLPGTAWAARHAIVFRDLEDARFKRLEAAKAIGLTCGVALPVFDGDVLKAVVVFLSLSLRCLQSRPGVGDRAPICPDWAR